MADNFVNIQTVGIGAFTGSTVHPVIFIPPDKGAITLTEVYVVGQGAGTTIGLILTKMTAVGTPATSATLASFSGTFVYAEGVVDEATISTAKVDPGTTGCWLGVDQTSGTAPTTTTLHVSWVEGI
jgi:hypothetical protein